MSNLEYLGVATTKKALGYIFKLLNVSSPKSYLQIQPGKDEFKKAEWIYVSDP